MAQKCPACGGTSTSTNAGSFTCHTCGTTSDYTAPADRGRVPNPDGPADYYGDDGVTYAGDETR